MRTPRPLTWVGFFLCVVCIAKPALSVSPATAREPRDETQAWGAIQDIEFISGDATLSGSLVLPADGRVLRAVVVFVHGSGPQERSLPLANHFARSGVGAFVYDKRGVGKSGGRYEAAQAVSGDNIDRLAEDAAAALAALRERPALDGAALGLAGISQAGWIAPLAAHKSGLAHFLLLWSGPVCKVSEEDIFSKYTNDRDRPGVPSYAEALAARTSPYRWQDFLGTDSDPVASLRQISIPGLWIFGGKDGSIPVDLSMERLDVLREEGLPYEYVLFSESGNNNIPETFATALGWLERQLNSLAAPN
ncbi:MAG: alpha/beta hydrolase [Pseudomonadota bacterium]